MKSTTSSSGSHAVLWPLGACVLTGLIGCYPTLVTTGAAGLRSMAAALTIVLGVVYGTFLPTLRRMANAGQGEVFQIAIKAAATRFLLTLLISAAVAWRRPAGISPGVLLVWIAIAYVVMIKVETLAIVARMKNLEKR